VRLAGLCPHSALAAGRAALPPRDPGQPRHRRRRQRFRQRRGGGRGAGKEEEEEEEEEEETWPKTRLDGFVRIAQEDSQKHQPRLKYCSVLPDWVYFAASP